MCVYGRFLITTQLVCRLLLMWYVYNNVCPSGYIDGPLSLYICESEMFWFWFQTEFSGLFLCCLTFWFEFFRFFILNWILSPVSADDFLPLLKSPIGLVGEEAANVPSQRTPLANMSIKHPFIEIQWVTSAYWLKAAYLWCLKSSNVTKESEEVWHQVLLCSDQLTTFPMSPGASCGWWLYIIYNYPFFLRVQKLSPQSS